MLQERGGRGEGTPLPDLWPDLWPLVTALDDQADVAATGLMHVGILAVAHLNDAESIGDMETANQALTKLESLESGEPTEESRTVGDKLTRQLGRTGRIAADAVAAEARMVTIRTTIIAGKHTGIPATLAEGGLFPKTLPT